MTLQSIGTADFTSVVWDILELKDGRVLVRTEKGLFLLGTNAMTLQPIGMKDPTGVIYVTQELKDGRVFVGTDKGLFLLGANAISPQPVGTVDLTGSIWKIQGLKDGRVLVWAENGLFLLLGAFDQAQVNFAKLPTILAAKQATTIEVGVSAKPCANSIKLLNPQLRISRVGASPEELALINWLDIDGRKVTFSYKFPVSGPYSLQFLLGGVPWGDKKEVTVKTPQF